MNWSPTYYVISFLKPAHEIGKTEMNSRALEVKSNNNQSLKIFMCPPSPFSHKEIDEQRSVSDWQSQTTGWAQSLSMLDLKAPQIGLRDMVIASLIH